MRKSSYQDQLHARVAMSEGASKLKEKFGTEVSKEDLIQIFEKAEKIQQQQEKRKKLKKTIKNSVEQDFSKGSVRNQLCPLCNVKLKKCKCGLLL